MKLGLWGGLAAALTCVWAVPSPAQPASIDSELQPYSQPGLLADVGDGRHIHLFCTGSGTPTVILTAGLGNWSEVWRKVQPAIAKRARVCAWDRAGFGFSSPSSQAQDVLHTTADLERALKAAGISGPYLLVGHSLGGYESLLFADRHPKDVVGMVLVDPSIPDQLRILTSYVGPETAAINKTYTERYTGFLRGCEEGVRAGTVKPGADPAGCLKQPADYPVELKSALLPGLLEPAKYATMRSLVENTDRDGVLVVNGSRDYGAMPMIVLTAGDAPSLPPQLNASGAAASGYRKYGAEGRRAAHAQLAALSSRGEHRAVEGTAHYIQLLKPEAVITAIGDMLTAASASR